MARRSRIRMVLAGLSLAGLGLLTPMGSASAATAPPSPPQEGENGVSAQQVPSAAADCWTTITQPGGPGTTVNVIYRNCGAASAYITPNSHATAFVGSYTYVRFCRVVQAGATLQWIVPPASFPPVDTNRWGVTNCI
jgi:hypothetical protein